MKSLLRKIYLYRAVQDFVLLYPLYAILLADQGLNAVQISTLFIIWSAVGIAAEVPSGVLADKFSRRWLLALAQFIRAIGYGFWLFMPTYEGFAIGFALWGLGGALMSGTFEALVFDELKAVGREGEYVKVAGRAESFSLVAILLAGVGAAGGILLGFDVVTVASIVAVIMAGCIALTLPETKRVESTGEVRYWQILKTGVLYAFNTPLLLRIMVAGGLIVAFDGTLEEYVPLFIQATGALNWQVALVDAATVAAAAAASFWAYRLEGLGNYAIGAVVAGAGGLLLAAGSFNGLPAWVLLVTYSFVMTSMSTIFGGRLQHAMGDGAMRATVTSVYGFVQEILVIGLFVVYGFIALKFGHGAAFRWAGALVVLVALCSVAGHWLMRTNRQSS